MTIHYNYMEPILERIITAELTERIITEFPAALAADEAFSFTFEGASYHASANYPHVFPSAEALVDHLVKAARGQYDGLTLLA